MFRPLDIPIFDTDWPVEGGRITGLHDIRVIVHTRPSNASWPVPCEVVITAVTSSSITVGLASRATLSTYSGTTLQITGLGSTATGKVVRQSSSIMTVDVVRNTYNLEYTGTLPLRVVPCCVMWLPPYIDKFSLSQLPDPGTGWIRVIDNDSKTITYTADDHIDNGHPSDSRLRLVNGISRPEISLSADGSGTVITDTTTNTITITAGER